MRVDLAVHPAKDQTDKSGKKLPTWDMNEAEERVSWRESMDRCLVKNIRLHKKGVRVQEKRRCSCSLLV